MTRQTILFDEGPVPGGTLFADPRQIIRADTPGQVAAALAAMMEAQDRGFWLAGMASYELGYLYSSKLRALMPPARDTPLLLFGVFDAPAPAASWRAGAQRDAQAARMDQPVPQWSAEDYAAPFAQVKELIAAGDIYQANLTFPLTGTWQGTAPGIYAALAARQPVSYGAFVDLDEDGPAILSRSPELFFRCDGQGAIETRPMKGTQPRAATRRADEAARRWLARDPKNRAENLMIVDLLRNDMSRVAQVGSVKVPQLFHVESYATVHQMTSLVQARLRPGVRLPDILAALFPCGSITGAPKIRAMQILRAMEPAPRGIYCGSIGWVAPDGAMSFNVAIRTLVLHRDGRLRLNVGGGIVHDSSAAAEYEEALWKARFAHALTG
ncbi:aminodeoxychorismate synthase component I [Brevirhabdus sp.]|uniref:aminodeoxychorismate synthase component I n=1 Tax=Brevirhabdus sp. TaxID=2004514 RepID=UPI004058CEE7